MKTTAPRSRAGRDAGRPPLAGTRKTFAVATLLAGFALVLWAPSSQAVEGDLMQRVKDGYADSNGVKIHYVEVGQGPLVVMIHGFPDFWYTWRKQMEALASDYHVVAVDQRGYNLSDKPKGVESYAMPLLVGDIAAVIHHLGEEKAIVVGHDWGGAVAWQVALNLPQMVDKLIICNLPHPNGMTRELATNPVQQRNSEYARNFQKEGAEENLSAELLAGIAAGPDQAARQVYLEAFKRSDFAAMLNYYKANYPRPPYEAAWERVQQDPGPKVAVPVLMFHGLADTALNAKGLDDTWEWLDSDLTLVTVPGASHWVQRDAEDLVSNTMKWWLAMRRQ